MNCPVFPTSEVLRQALDIPNVCSYNESDAVNGSEYHQNG